MGETVAGSFLGTPVPHSEPSLRFQQPLIKPSVPFSSTRLTDEIMHSPTEGAPETSQGKSDRRSHTDPHTRDIQISCSSPCVSVTDTHPAHSR